MPDSLRDGRFVLLAPLGEGSQGRTFDAVDKREGKAVAIKRFDVARAKAWKDVELAEREARVLQSLDHPKLPAYLDHFEEDGALYLAMEKIEGETVASLRKRGVALGEADVVRFLRDASDVLAYLHSRSPPVIHRDLKPGNVIRRPDGSFAFVDFGAVRDKLRPEGGSTVVGTFGFMAPEQFQGRALPASDVYAVGATAIAMLTGREPEELPHVGLGLDVRSALRGVASERMIATLAKMLDSNPDTRARAIAPLLERLGEPTRRDARVDQKRESRAEQRSAPHGPEEGFERQARELNRQARRAAKRAERTARRAARRRRRMHGGRVPFPISLLFTLGLMVGIVAVTIATQLVVPILFRILSVFFARRALLAAAEGVRAEGAHAIDGMHRSLAWMRGDAVGGGRDDPRVRVEEVEEVDQARTRVAGDDEAVEPENRDDSEGAPSPTSRGARPHQTGRRRE